jgi:N-acetylglucosaminyldiphosphoundecaprenol N-acetyl-beta-D-mannosaminyltransferase
MSDCTHTRSFLGIRFWNAEPQRLIDQADLHGGLFTCPSAPSLAEMRTDPFLRRAYQASDWAVVDGGYVALILRLILRYPIARISGLQILQRLFGVGYEQALQFQNREIFWVVPNEEEKNRIETYLLSLGMDSSRQHYYQAPFYKADDSYNDVALQNAVKESNADWVILCIGGGKQEKLGLYLRNALQQENHQPAERKKGPAILCTGGAIAFLTGGQASIPSWADRVYLGWFYRIAQNPKVFLKRYWIAAWSFPCLLWSERNSLYNPPSNPLV